MSDLKELRAGEAAMLLEESRARERMKRKEITGLVRKGKVQPVFDVGREMGD